MSYRLRSDLSKTKVCRIIADNNSIGVQLPSVRQCTFRKHRGTYWVTFGGLDSFYDITLTTWAGFVRICFSLCEVLEDGKTRYTDLAIISLPFQYCLDSGILREVA